MRRPRAQELYELGWHRSTGRRSDLLLSCGMMSWSNQFQCGPPLRVVALTTFRRRENAVLKVMFGARSTGADWWLPPHVGASYALVEDRVNANWEAGWDARRGVYRDDRTVPQRLPELRVHAPLQKGDAARAAKCAYAQGPDFPKALQALLGMSEGGEAAVAELLRPGEAVPRQATLSSECSW